MIKLGLIYFLLIGLVELTPLSRIHRERGLAKKINTLSQQSD